MSAQRLPNARGGSYLAMVEVFAQTRASPADAAIWAVVDALLAVVIPKLANIAVVTCGWGLAIDAVVSRLLRRSASHAEHVLGQLPVQIVVFYCIMTVSASVPVQAVETLHLYIPLVVLAPKRGRISRSIVLFLLAILSYCVLPRWAICRIGVARSQTVRVFGVDVGCSRYERGRLRV